MAKYTLLKNKDGGRAIRINKTGAIIEESENPEEYMRLRKRAQTNARQREQDGVLRDLGLTKVRGAVSGKTYWE